MPYARRDAQGQVTSLHREPSAEAAEFLADDHPDVRAFLGQGHVAASERFAQLDAGFVRVLEDLIDTLINRNLINITDLPAEAQAKLFSRKSFRERRSSQALRLFGDETSPLVPTVPGLPPADEPG